MLSAAEARARGLGTFRGVVFVLGFDAAVVAVIWWVVTH